MTKPPIAMKPNPSLGPVPDVDDIKVGDILEVSSDGYMRKADLFFPLATSAVMGGMIGWLLLFVMYTFKVLP